MSGAGGAAPAGPPAVHRWGRYEVAVPLALPAGADPLRDVRLTAGFSGPSGQRHAAPGFWDGADTWRVRFAPDEVGPWTYTLALEGPAGAAGAPPGGAFGCVPYEGDNPYYRHGPVRRYGPDRRRLAHADGTPWLYLADTVWNGPIRSTPAEWDAYVAARKAQGFTAAQFVATQWHAAPDGGPDGPAWVGGERVSGLNPGFFRRLDARLDALTAAGIAGVPVLLWAIRGGTNNESNPGNVLSEADCALLAGYQVARWHAHPVLWILNGDGKYLGEEGARWRRIGRAVFGATDGATRAPAMVHPGGQTWVGDEFATEPWLDVVGYQSGHGDDERAWRWIVEGPPATAWRDLPDKVVMNLESPYEDHLAYQSRERHPAVHVRRANYWSLLVSPTAGVTYGGHGVWGWDDGSGPPVAHASTGTPRPWQEALHLPGAQQMAHLARIFTALPWWQLQPAPDVLQEQPGATDVRLTVAAARDPGGRLALLYLPAGGPVRLDTRPLAAGLTATWIDPRSGGETAAGPVSRGAVTLTAPDGEDWVLLLRAA